jgi:hypothetical protein
MDSSNNKDAISVSTDSIVEKQHEQQQQLQQSHQKEQQKDQQKDQPKLDTDEFSRPVDFDAFVEHLIQQMVRKIELYSFLCVSIF